MGIKFGEAAANSGLHGGVATKGRRDVCGHESQVRLDGDVHRSASGRDGTGWESTDPRGAALLFGISPGSCVQRYIVEGTGRGGPEKLRQTVVEIMDV